MSGAVAAVVLGAGRSSRMGQPKLLLPWGDRCVIGHIVDVLAQAGLSEIVVVTGWAHAQVEAALRGLPARAVFNPRYAEDQMAYSLAAGCAAVSAATQAVLVVLGDQPQLEAAAVQAVLAAHAHTQARVVIPTYQGRRGHPWLIQRDLWDAIAHLLPNQTMRDVIQNHADQVYLAPVMQASILKDLDTPQDYAREKPLV